MREKAPLRGKHPKGSKGGRSIAVGNGCKDVRLVATLRQALHEAGTGRDRVGNRQLFYDQYATLRVLYFFTPTVTSLRRLQQRSELRKVQQRGAYRARA